MQKTSEDSKKLRAIPKSHKCSSQLGRMVTECIRGLSLLVSSVDLGQSKASLFKQYEASDCLHPLLDFPLMSRWTIST